MNEKVHPYMIIPSLQLGKEGTITYKRIYMYVCMYNLKTNLRSLNLSMKSSLNKIEFFGHVFFQSWFFCWMDERFIHMGY